MVGAMPVAVHDISPDFHLWCKSVTQLYGSWKEKSSVNNEGFSENIFIVVPCFSRLTSCSFKNHV